MRAVLTQAGLPPPQLVDITADPALAHWRLHLPVLLIAGQPVFRHKVTPRQLKLALGSATARRVYARRLETALAKEAGQPLTG